MQQCTEALFNKQHANVQARAYVRAEAKRIEALKCVANAKKERHLCFFVSKAQVSTNELIELFGTTKQCHSCYFWSF